MIIACPACSTRYAVPDNTIGVEGRTVRCAKCRHSWFQQGAALPDAPERRAPPQAQAQPPAAPWPEPSSRPQPSPPPFAVPDDAPPPVKGAAGPGEIAYAGDESPGEADAAPRRPWRRRLPPRLQMPAALAFAVVTLGAVVAVAHYGLPAWVPFGAAERFADDQPGLTLDFPPNRQDRRILPDGSPYFGVSGTISNVDSERHTVPDLLILLLNDNNRVVYSWVESPPRRTLAPGESESIIEARTDVPRSAKTARIGWKPG